MNIIVGDCLNIVGELGEFDYLITDPPYPTGGLSSLKSHDAVTDVREMIDGMFQSFFYAVFKAIKKKEHFRMWIFTDWRQVSFLSALLRREGYGYQSAIVWDKMRGSLSGLYHPSYEMILYASNVSTKSAGYLGRDLVSMARVNNKERTHAFEKPSELVEKLCCKFPVGRVIDPFCGTGSLLIGAKKIGWNGVGIDISKECVAIANDRLNKKEVK